MDLFFIISTTHWDREWYRTFNDFRIRLCDLIDELLKLLDRDPDFRCFTFDGQTVMLEDYLEIHPENEEILKKYIREGRISIGPWYVIPDEFIPSGEATIRNLLIGDEISKKFGKKLMCSYLPDNFGHISQMPQILNDFHIDNAIFLRGIDKKRIGNSEFFWESPDGTRAICKHLSTGYWNFKSWGLLGMDTLTHFENTARPLKNFTSTGLYLMINGSDHFFPQSDLTVRMDEIKKAFPGVEIVNGSLDEFMDLLKSRVDTKSIAVIKGELRDGKDSAVNMSVGSTRYYIKQHNYKCEAELEKYAEPLNSFIYAMGGKYNGSIIKKSWKELIQNNPHDSVCGCSSDEVMQDIVMRYKHSYEISSSICELSLEKLGPLLSTQKLGGKDRALLVYNPLNWRRTDIAEAEISFPLEDGVKDLKLFDEYDNCIEYEITDIYEKIELEEFKHKSKEKHKVRCFKVKFTACDVPPTGYKTYKVVPLELTHKMPYVQRQIIKNFNKKIENEFYSISANTDGTLSIFDKKNNNRYDGMNLFEDRGDSGDEYQYSAPLIDEVYYPTLKSLSVIGNTSIEATLKMEFELNIPESLDSKYMRRTGQIGNCPITSCITLYKNIDRIDFKTTIHNNAADHILCVKFPTDIRSDYDYSHNPFDIVERKVDIDRVEEGDSEVLTSFKPSHTFVSINGQGKALTLAKKGIYEHQVKRSETGLDMILTLVRSVRWMFREVLSTSEDGQPCTTPVVYTPEAGCIGTGIFEYSLIFHKCGVVEDRVYKKAYDFNYPLRARAFHKCDDGILPLEYSWFNISDDRIIVSAIKKCEYDPSIVVRMYNISDAIVEYSIGFSMPVIAAQISNSLEESVGALKTEGGRIMLKATGKKIVTVKIFFNI